MQRALFWQLPMVFLICFFFYIYELIMELYTSGSRRRYQAGRCQVKVKSSSKCCVKCGWSKHSIAAPLANRSENARILRIRPGVRQARDSCLIKAIYLTSLSFSLHFTTFFKPSSRSPPLPHIL